MSFLKPLAVVTGASSGIGRELAREFARNHFDLIIASESEGILSVVPELEVTGSSVQAVQVDLATYEGVEALVSQIAAAPVAAVAINAGVGVGGDFTLGTNLDDELRMIQLNVTSAVHLAKRILPGMVARGEGKVLFTSSVAATMPAPFEAVYGATKAFLLSFSEAIRNELKDTGVTVTALMPGPTDTNFFQRAGMEDTRVGSSSKDDPADVARMGFEAMMAGKDSILASSLKTKLMGAMNELAPETMKAEAHRKLSEPGSGEAK